MARIEHIIDETGRCKVFSSIDLYKKCLQLPLREEHKKVTAFGTSYDMYEYNILPLGWKNSPY